MDISLKSTKMDRNEKAAEKNELPLLRKFDAHCNGEAAGGFRFSKTYITNSFLFMLENVLLHRASNIQLFTRRGRRMSKMDWNNVDC